MRLSSDRYGTAPKVLLTSPVWLGAIWKFRLPNVGVNVWNISELFGMFCERSSLPLGCILATFRLVVYAQISFRLERVNFHRDAGDGRRAGGAAARAGKAPLHLVETLVDVDDDARVTCA